MSKTAISIRLGEPEVQALEHFANDTGLTRSRVIEAIIQNFLAQDFIAQGVVLRDALGIRRAAIGSRPKRWGV